MEKTIKYAQKLLILIQARYDQYIWLPRPSIDESVDDFLRRMIRGEEYEKRMLSFKEKMINLNPAEFENVEGLSSEEKIDIGFYIDSMLSFDTLMKEKGSNLKNMYRQIMKDGKDIKMVLRNHIHAFEKRINLQY